MRVLLDEQLPRHLVREIRGHEVSTVQQRGWAGLKNGELLQVAADTGFQVLVTADRNLQFQQNLSRSRIGIILLVAPSNALEDLLPLVPNLLAAIPKTRAGELLRVERSSR
jgi:predicted nuclease of predicted toxin-antitoxin system